MHVETMIEVLGLHICFELHSDVVTVAYWYGLRMTKCENSANSLQNICLKLAVCLLFMQTFFV